VPRLRAAGFTISSVGTFPIINTRLVPNTYSHGLVDLILDFLEDRETVDRQELAAWAAELHTLSDEGRYFFSTTRCFFGARKPVGHDAARRNRVPKGNSCRRGLINVALNGLVSTGVIAGFRTNYATKEEPDQLQIRVTSPSGASEESIRATVLQALGEVGEGAEIVVEPSGPQAARR